MIVDIIILALLSKSRRHGYDIKKDVDRILFRQGRMNNNLLYPALHRLEGMGAIEKEIQPQKGKPNRHVYGITTVGNEILMDMVGQYDESDAVDDGEFLSRLAFFDLIEPTDQARILDLRERELKRRLEHRAGLTADYIDEYDSPWVVRLMTFEKERLEREIAWIEELKNHVRPKRGSRAARRKAEDLS